MNLTAKQVLQKARAVRSFEVSAEWRNEDVPLDKRACRQRLRGRRCSVPLIGFLVVTGIWTIFCLGQSVHAELVSFEPDRQLKRPIVCFFPSSLNRDLLVRFTNAKEQRCFPLDDAFNMPRGNWAVVLWSGDGKYVSTHPANVVVSSSRQSAGRPSGLQISTTLATTLDVKEVTTTLSDGESLVFYIANDGVPQAPPSIRPFLESDGEILLPARTRIIPLILRGTEPARVGQGIRLEPGQRNILHAFDPPRNSTVIVRLVGEITAHIESRKVYLENGENKIIAEFRGDLAMVQDLAFFDNVPPGHYALLINDDEKHTRKIGVIDVNPSEKGKVVVSAPIDLSEGVENLIRWQLTSAYPASRSSGCGHTIPAPITLKLLNKNHHIVRTAHFDDGKTSGEVQARLAPGEYTCELWIDGTILARQQALTVSSTRAVATTLVRVDLGGVSGRVTKRGKPQHARVTIPRWGTLETDATSGTYSAWSPDTPHVSRLVVELCEPPNARYTVSRSENESRMPIFDVEIPDNQVLVRVVDSGTGEPIGNAVVDLTQSPATGGTIDLALPETNDDGTTSIATLMPDIPTRICAAHQEYQPTCKEFELNADTHETVELRLSPDDAEYGQINTTQPVESGTIWWLQQGQVVARARVSAEGRFRIPARMRERSTHNAVITARSIGIATLTTLEENQYNLAMASQIKTLVINRDALTAKADSRLPIGLAIGSAIIPVEVLNSYLAGVGGALLGARARIIIERIHVVGALGVLVGAEILPDTPATGGGIPFVSPRIAIVAPDQTIVTLSD